MPTQANIVVKKADGTTDVTYTGVVASAGDKTSAVWRNNAVGTASAFRPELQLSSGPNGPGTARRLPFRYSYPTTVTGSDGKISVSHRLIMEGSVLVPQSMPDADVAEAVAQGCNLLASAHIKASISSGYAPT